MTEAEEHNEDVSVVLEHCALLEVSVEVEKIRLLCVGGDRARVD